MPAPCVGCPPCCMQCPIGIASTDAEVNGVVIPAEDYGCAKGFGGIVKTDDGQLGQMRNGKFHPITPTGAAFLRESGSPLAEYLN